MILAKYNQTKTITFKLFEIDGIDLSVAATFAVGDVKIMKDEGVEANTTNLPTDEGNGYSLVLTATEISASRIRIYFIDQTVTKVWLDTSIGIETYGNASAEHAFDLDTASTPQTADHTSAIAAIPTSLVDISSLATGADLATVDTVVDGIQSDLDNGTDGLGAIKTAVDTKSSQSSITTAQNDLDTITGSDGVTLATAQALYAPNKVEPPTLPELEARTLLAADYATADALSNLAVGSAAISAPATGLAPSIGGYTGIVGTPVNTYASTETLNQVYHEITGTDPNLDVAYAFDVGDNGVGTEIVMIGRFVGNGNETIDVQAWNFSTTAWDGIGSFISSNGDTDGTSDGESRFNINKGHTGVNGSDKGVAYIRGISTNMSSATLKMDQVYMSYAVVAQSVGYDGAQVWIDTVNGVAGTTKYINGVADNPVLTLADAITIGANVPLKRYNVSPDSSILFTESHTDEIWVGAGWSLDLGSSDVSSSHFFHCNDISGIGTSPSGEVHILNSHIGALTLGVTHITDSSFSSSFTASAPGGYTIEGGGSGVAGSNSPTMTYSGLGSSSTLNARRWTGGASWILDSNITASIEVLIGGTHTITTGGADVEFRGTPKALVIIASGVGTINVDVWSGCPITISGTATTTINIVGIHGGVTDTSTGTTVTTSGSTDITQLNAVLIDTDDLQQAQSDWATAVGFATETKQDASDVLIADIPNTAEFEARTPTASQLLYIVENASAGYPVTFSAGSTTSVTLTNVDGSTASAVNDQYKGRLLVFTSGANKGVVTDITAYNGTTKVATITGVPSDPSASSARLI